MTSRQNGIGLVHRRRQSQFLRNLPLEWKSTSHPILFGLEVHLKQSRICLDGCLPGIAPGAAICTPNFILQRSMLSNEIGRIKSPKREYTAEFKDLTACGRQQILVSTRDEELPGLALRLADRGLRKNALLSSRAARAFVSGMRERGWGRVIQVSHRNANSANAKFGPCGAGTRAKVAFAWVTPPMAVSFRRETPRRPMSRAQGRARQISAGVRWRAAYCRSPVCVLRPRSRRWGWYERSSTRARDRAGA